MRRLSLRWETLLLLLSPSHMRRELAVRTSPRDTLLMRLTLLLLVIPILWRE